MRFAYVVFGGEHTAMQAAHSRIVDATGAVYPCAEPQEHDGYWTLGPFVTVDDYMAVCQERDALKREKGETV